MVGEKLGDALTTHKDVPIVSFEGGGSTSQYVRTLKNYH